MLTTMTTDRPILAFLMLALQFTGSAPARDPMTALIVGQVVDGESGRPVRSAIVALAGPAAPNGVPAPRVLTGSDGRFVFRGLRRGSYRITALKPGYVDGAHGQTRPAGPSVPLTLGEGERTSDAVIRLWRQAALGGTVVDESGEPLIGIRVQAYRRTVVSGRRRYVPVWSAATDDRGTYRIGSLIPGDYIVGAVGRHEAVPLATFEVIRTPDGRATIRTGPGGEGMVQVRDAGYMLRRGTPTPPPPENGRLAIYPATFHPSAPSGDAATIIPLAPGGDYPSADIQVKPVPGVSVSGHVVGPDGPVTTTTVRLVASETAEILVESDAIAASTDRSGHFTFPAVPAGHYSLRLLRGADGPPNRADLALNSVVWTDLPVSVGNEDIENLTVEAHAGVRVGGTIQFEGTSPRPPFSAVEILIEPADPLSLGIGSGRRTVRAGPAAEFASPPLPGGRYYVRIQNSPSGWMFKSATVEGRDVADMPLTVTADTANVVITFTDRWSGLRGLVQDGRGADANAAVIVFPVDTDAWTSTGAASRRVRLLRVSKNGEYSINLPPGEYYVIAVPDAQTADWQDPAFLETASRAATRLTIADGERRSQDLRTRELR